jgi:hypothetical protein
MAARRASTVIGAAAAAVAAVIAGVAAAPEAARATRTVTVAEATPAERLGTAAERNTARADYVGPDACGECHAENHARWRRSLHAAMNATAGATTPAGGAAVRGDFDGARLRYGDGVATFERAGGEYVMRLARPGKVERRYRVTRTIGSRYLQEYVGVQTAGPEPAGDPVYATEIRLPFGYWLARPGWYPQPYYDSWFPAEYAEDGTPRYDPFFPEPTAWASRCAWCHNTYAFDARLARSDALGVGHGLEQFYRGTAVADPDLELAPIAELVTVGISCESCHLGGRDHADGGAIWFTPRGPDLVRRAPGPALGGRDDAVVINAICAQCHSTPAPRFPDGASARNSSEALDLAAGACAGIKCNDCHDPHTAGPGPLAPDQPAHLAACAGCHTMASDHARHAPTDATCLDCHMPRIVQGISAFVRTHRISSPSDPAMLADGGVNACNLCHLDRSVAWTVDQLRTHWNTSPTLTAPASTDPAGPRWLASSHGAIRITAAHAYAHARVRDPDTLRRLAAIVDDPIAYYRMWTVLAIEAALGRRLTRDEYDPLAPPAIRAAQTGDGVKFGN